MLTLPLSNDDVAILNGDELTAELAGAGFADVDVYVSWPEAGQAAVVVNAAGLVSPIVPAALRHHMDLESIREMQVEFEAKADEANAASIKSAAAVLDAHLAARRP